MNNNIQKLIDGYLDETLSGDQETELIHWLKSCPSNAKIFASAIQFHNKLHDLIQTEKTLILHPMHETQIFQKVNIRPEKNYWTQTSITAGIASMIGIIIFVYWGFFTSHASATSEIERIANSASSLLDRTYKIKALDNTPEILNDRQPGIDGGILHVQPPDKYVLIRKFPDKRPFITGSDGSNSWSIPPEGAIRISTNELRFIGPVPGNQHGIPFVDLRSDLAQLKTAYELDFLPNDKNGLRGIKANKKSAEHRGPKRVELWYEPKTGVLQKMIFSGMPQGRGGPSNVSAELIDNSKLPEGFFKHNFHHLPDRQIIEEN